MTRDRLPIGSTWKTRPDAGLAEKVPLPWYRIHKWTIFVAVGLMVFLTWFNFTIRQGILSSDSLSVNHTEYSYGLPMEARLDWQDYYYPVPGSLPGQPGAQAPKVVRGTIWRPLGLTVDLLVLVLLVAGGTLAYRGMVTLIAAMWRVPPPRPPPLPDESMDGEPADPSWDEAKNQ